MSFFNFPTEIQLHVFSYFNDIELLQSREVCRKFKLLAEHNSLWNTSKNKIEAIARHLDTTIDPRQTQCQNFIRLINIMREDYQKIPHAKLFFNPPKEIEQEHERIVVRRFQKDRKIFLEEGANNQFNGFETLRRIINEFGPFELHMINLNLESNHLNFLDELISQGKIVCLSFTKDNISVEKINSLKDRMLFFEDGIEEKKRPKTSLLLYLRQIHSES